MKDLLIIGAGGFGREVAWLVEAINRQSGRWNLLGFIDEDPGKLGNEINGYPVLGNLETLDGMPPLYTVCAVSAPGAKKRIAGRIEPGKHRFATLVHPEVHIAPTVSIGAGTVIAGGCLVTVNISIGNHVSINPGCGIGHDAVISDYCTLMWHVNVSGAVVLSEGCVLGTKATALQNVVVGRGSILGAGAVATRDMPPRCTAVGIPAVPIKFHKGEE